MYEKELAERLIELRLQRNVSAREMSLALGQNSSYINRIENQKVFPSMQGFFYICEYLKVTPAEFFSTNNTAPVQSRALSDKICKLTPTQIDLLEQLIDHFK